ncbi:ABC transporter ATP-binding protein [Embleya sp. NPDC050154]|uniref:ABC transporter ATP-binding protein n=1 Tax=Embleya sp. NPDC050154 TaxID=3363988 RepID=UPI0037931F31
MIEFRDVTITYADAPEPALRDVELSIPEGELCLVVGRTGAGKSTLLGAINGLVPHFTGGTLRGSVLVDGIDTRSRPPREFAHLVGVVGQDPLAGFVTDTVEEELAYGMEQLAIPSPVMRKRVEETLDLLGIAELRHRPLRTLSGGQQQRVAIGSVLTAHPRVLVLDEPTSALDPTAAEDVLAAITRLVHDLGITAIVAEHRMERVVQYADRLVHLPGDRTVRDGPPAEILQTCDIAPPVVELGRLAGWSPLPLSVRDARRLAAPLRARLVGRTPPQPGSPAGPSASLLTARRIIVRYGDVIAVRGLDLDLPPGQVTALMGRNGSGKSSLLWALQGSGPRQGGTVDVAGEDPGKAAPQRARALVGLVPQTPGDLLYLETVDAECAEADRESDAEAGACRALLDRIAPDIDGALHPRDVSEGQRLALVLAIQLVAAPRVVLLDEPTRGLDYHAKRRFVRVVRELADAGRAIVLATHDVEFVAQVADRVVVMAEGDIVADGPTAEVVVSSPAFAPQVAKILAPAEWLTVATVGDALAEAEAEAEADAADDADRSRLVPPESVPAPRDVRGRAQDRETTG